MQENERINEQHGIFYSENKLKEQTLTNSLNQKESEIMDLTNKINELESNIEKYEGNLINIRQNYDSTVYEYQQEISRKNDDINFMIQAHAKEIKDVKLKINFKILMKVLYKNF